MFKVNNSNLWQAFYAFIYYCEIKQRKPIHIFFYKKEKKNKITVQIIEPEIIYWSYEEKIDVTTFQSCNLHFSF